MTVQKNPSSIAHEDMSALQTFPGFLLLKCNCDIEVVSRIYKVA